MLLKWWAPKPFYTFRIAWFFSSKYLNCTVKLLRLAFFWSARCLQILAEKKTFPRVLKATSGLNACCDPPPHPFSTAFPTSLPLYRSQGTPLWLLLDLRPCVQSILQQRLFLARKGHVSRLHGENQTREMLHFWGAIMILIWGGIKSLIWYIGWYLS